MCGKKKLFMTWLLVGALLALSWSMPVTRGYWDYWDISLFGQFNQLLAQSHAWANGMAIINHRLFDSVMFGAMLTILGRHFYQQTGQARRHLLAMALVMVASAVLINQLGHALPVVRASPTLLVEGAVRLAQVSRIASKDASSDSFPGDHGLLLMIFAAFALRYLPWSLARWALLMVPVFAAPRVLVGAHWFSDVAVGALALSALTLPWLLLTPCTDRLIAWLEPKLVWVKRFRLFAH